MSERTKRTELLLGKTACEKLNNSKVLLFGLGGVGGYVFEALVRAGVGEITVVDNDKISESNINRQILATTETVGLLKTETAVKRGLSINPDLKITAINLFYGNDVESKIDFNGYSYVIDAVDTVTAKLLIIEKSIKAGVPVISCMGTGNKMIPKFTVKDISETDYCPLARVMRKELKRRGITTGVKAVFSDEIPFTAEGETPELKENSRPVPASVSFVPAVAGLTVAGEVVSDITGVKGKVF